jgi:hypothetical protein
METNNNTILEEPKEVPVDDDKKPIDEVEAAAYFINQAHTEFRRLAFALADRKKHSVSRVLEAVLFEPLEKIELLGKHEQELFEICQQVMYNKGKVLQYAFKRIEDKKEKVDEQKV